MLQTHSIVIESYKIGILIKMKQKKSAQYRNVVCVISEDLPNSEAFMSVSYTDYKANGCYSYHKPQLEYHVLLAIWLLWLFCIFLMWRQFRTSASRGRVLPLWPRPGSSNQCFNKFCLLLLLCIEVPQHYKSLLSVDNVTLYNAMYRLHSCPGIWGVVRKFSLWDSFDFGNKRF